MGSRDHPSRLRVEIRALHVRERRADHDAAPVVRLRRSAGEHGEIGQFRQRDVHPERAGSAAVGANARAKVGVEMLGCHEPLEQELRIDIGHDAPGFDHFAAFEQHACRAPGLDDDALNRRAHAERHAASRAFLCHRLRDRAHAADRVAPLAALAVDLAEHVVQQHIGGSRGVGAREIADDRVEAERRLDRRRLEPAVEHVAGALGEEVEHVAAAGQVERAKTPRELQGVEPARDVGEFSRSERRRRREQQLAQHVGHTIEHRVVRGQGIRVAAREFRDLGLRRREPAADLEVAALGQRQEIRHRAQHDLEPVLREPKVAHDARIEQADGIARRRVAESRMEFLGDRGAAKHCRAARARRHPARRGRGTPRRRGRCGRRR